MNDELNKEDTPNSSEDEPASLRVENEVNDDATVDSSSVDVAACKKKNNLPQYASQRVNNWNIEK